MFHLHVWKAQALGSLGPLPPMVAETMEELEKRLAALEKAMEEEAAGGSGLSELRFAKFLVFWMGFQQQKSIKWLGFHSNIRDSLQTSFPCH